MAIYSTRSRRLSRKHDIVGVVGLFVLLGLTLFSLAVPHESVSEKRRALIQDQICAAVEANPAHFLAAYSLDPRSFQSRYVNSDLMKEMFPEYRQDYDRIKRNLTRILEDRYAAGLISQGAYHQALGTAIVA